MTALLMSYAVAVEMGMPNTHAPLLMSALTAWWSRCQNGELKRSGSSTSVTATTAKEADLKQKKIHRVLNT